MITITEPKMNLVLYPSDILKVTCRPVTEFGPSLKSITDEMHKVMSKWRGIGLSAPQVNSDMSIIVFNTLRGEMQGMCKELINPVIEKSSKTKQTEIEGCLSLPGVFQPMTRPDSVVVRYQDVDGNSHVEMFTEFEAVVVQHEIDHLHGKVMLDRMSQFKRKLASRNMLTPDQIERMQTML